MGFRLEERTEEIFDHVLVQNTITSMLMAPVMQEPRVTTIVLGLWGVGVHANPEMMGTLFGESIVHGREVGEPKSDDDRSCHVMLGNLYHEIVFCVDDEKQMEGFQRGLAKTGVVITPV